MKELVSNLLLDPRNPRLPESLYDAPQSEIFSFLQNNGVLDELVDSMLQNGFFDHEPLIVLPPESKGKRVVVEGNRRLAALFLIHDFPIVDESKLLEQPSKAQIESLKAVQIYPVNDREEVSRFLGFRHVSGLKPWRPEAKARYIASEVGSAIGENADDPMQFVAKRVGSNKQGVRNAYLAFEILRHAKNECEANITHVSNERFGVWLRCMNSGELRNYIGIGSPKTASDVADDLLKIDCAKLCEVIADLTPSGEKTKPVLADSRDVTVYGQVLTSTKARPILRKYNDLQVAKQVVERENLPSQIGSIKDRIDAIREEIETDSEKPDAQVSIAVDSLVKSARLLGSTVHTLSNE